MQTRKRRKSDRAGRAAIRSPGRPPIARREEQQRFWKAIARGLSSEDAAVSCGVSPPVGGRWFREGGGMPPISVAPRSARSLSFAEREEIAILSARGAGVRDIARRLRRAPSTVSRELRRNAATRSGGLAYRASTAQWHSDRRAKRPKTQSMEVRILATLKGLPDFTCTATGLAAGLGEQQRKVQASLTKLVNNHMLTQKASTHPSDPETRYAFTDEGRRYLARHDR